MVTNYSTKELRKERSRLCHILPSSFHRLLDTFPFPFPLMVTCIALDTMRYSYFLTYHFRPNLLISL